MKSNEAGGNIYSTIIAVMRDIKPVAKGRTNQQQRFQYRSIDDVMNELQPLFAKHGLFVVPTVLSNTREERHTAKGGSLIYSICKTQYRFYAEDGSYVDATIIGEGMDSGDKASNKSMSAAMKYVCLQVLCIPTEDAKDPDAESYAVQPEQQTTSVQSKTVTRDMLDKLNELIIHTETDPSAILDAYKVAKLSCLTVEQARQAIRRLQQRANTAEQAC